MGALRSKLFTEADAATIKKLEDCATGKPNEAMSHFRRNHVNGKGEHILRVQQALENVRKSRPELGIPEFAVNGVYDASFAKAIYVYKEKRDIRNYANRIDDIVGVKTLRSLDSDNINRPHIEPPPRPVKPPNVTPRPLPNCVPEADCPFSKEFSITVLFGASGGEIADFCKYWFAIKDKKNGLSALYLLSGYGVGISGSPVGGSKGGKAVDFSIGNDTRVTDFGPTAVFAGGMLPAGPFKPDVTLLTLQYRPGGSGFKSTAPIVIDAGEISFPGISINGSKFELLTSCRNGRGAVKRDITRGDLVFS